MEKKRKSLIEVINEPDLSPFEKKLGRRIITCPKKENRRTFVLACYRHSKGESNLKEVKMVLENDDPCLGCTRWLKLIDLEAPSKKNRTTLNLKLGKVRRKGLVKRGKKR